LREDVLLCVGGFDPTASAGIITDSITCRNIGVAHVALISALTTQNSGGFWGVEITPEKVFNAQFEKLLEDYSPKVIKTGMLPAKYQIDIIADYTRGSETLLVVDPVKYTSTGGELVADEVYEHLLEKLLPLCYLITPNIPEGEMITSRKINDVEDMIKATESIKDLGPYAVYLKGGHLDGEIIDILAYEGKISRFESKVPVKKNLRGTGCKFASALASYIMLEKELVKACGRAKNYIEEVLISPEKYY